MKKLLLSLAMAALGLCVTQTAMAEDKTPDPAVRMLNWNELQTLSEDAREEYMDNVREMFVELADVENMGEDAFFVDNGPSPLSPSWKRGYSFLIDGLQPQAHAQASDCGPGYAQVSEMFYSQCFRVVPKTSNTNAKTCNDVGAHLVTLTTGSMICVPDREYKSHEKAVKDGAKSLWSANSSSMFSSGAYQNDQKAIDEVARRYAENNRDRLASELGQAKAHQMRAAQERFTERMKAVDKEREERDKKKADQKAADEHSKKLVAENDAKMAANRKEQDQNRFDSFCKPVEMKCEKVSREDRSKALAAYRRDKNNITCVNGANLMKYDVKNEAASGGITTVRDFGDGTQNKCPMPPQKLVFGDYTVTCKKEKKKQILCNPLVFDAVRAGGKDSKTYHGVCVAATSTATADCNYLFNKERKKRAAAIKKERASYLITSAAPLKDAQDRLASAMSKQCSNENFQKAYCVECGRMSGTFSAQNKKNNLCIPKSEATDGAGRGTGGGVNQGGSNVQ